MQKVRTSTWGLFAYERSATLFHFLDHRHVFHQKRGLIAKDEYVRSAKLAEKLMEHGVVYRLRCWIMASG